ncbi:cytospin-A isoform X1 [Octopus sinensis]|uniref:Cytospin-A isoform X1 n=2 Tax=Octopus sinensis TaxID=2607531 RepID=A0A6P7TT23_9MOLL|nr:cytospin-A isoform X1 [Octopus sinensis]XP_036370888.1 cytospin-A isoform X1 [Octopus sinensis]
MPPKQGSLPQKKVGQKVLTMKKQEKGPSKMFVVSSNSTTTTTTTMTTATETVAPMRSKSENSGLSTISTSTPSSRKIMGAPLSKQYLSKSHENLTTHQQQKKKKQLSLLPDRPKVNSGGTGVSKTSSNKENVLKEKEKNVVFAKPAPTGTSATITTSSTTAATTTTTSSSSTTTKGGRTATGVNSTIRKASSTQNIDKTGKGVFTTGSAGLHSSGKTHSSMKRAHSSQSMTKDKTVRKRTSAPADVMAYNAELLANFEREKKALENRISELIQITEGRKAEIERHKYEIRNLKEQIPSQDLREECELLRNQNKVLQERLKEFGISIEQLPDAEKISMPKKTPSPPSSNQSEPASKVMPSSISCDNLSNFDSLREPCPRRYDYPMSEPGLTLDDLCGTPEHPSELSLDNVGWDKQSNKSSDAMSEVSVACLTERILQMEETHYSTNEELQATLQELSDLQDMVNELTEDNEKLADERGVVLESLCTQTEKLEHCRTQLEHLKSLLINSSLINSTEREQQMIDLLKSASIEREEMLRKQDEYSNELQMAITENREAQELVSALRDKTQLLQGEVDTLTEEKENSEKLISEMKQSLSDDRIEMTRYKTMLECERSKVEKLEQMQLAQDNKSDLEQLLLTTRKEKDEMEMKVTNLTEEILLLQREMEKVRGTLMAREEEVRGLKSNSKTRISELELKVDAMQKERVDIQQEEETLRDHIEQLEQDCDRYRDDVKRCNAKIQELQQEIKDLLRQKSVVESELHDVHHRHEEESEEWKQFQKDLQVAVVIANDFRTETQEDMERLVCENASMREKLKSLQSQLSKAKDELDSVKLRSWDERSSKPIFSPAELKGKMLSSVDRELIALREGRRMDSKNQTMSVKNLIRSIEDQVKSGNSSIHSSENSSRRSSLELVCCPLSPSNSDLTDAKSPSTPTDLSPQGSSELPLRSVLKRPAAEKLSPLQPLGTTFEKGKELKPVQQNNRNESEHSKVSPSISSILSSRSSSRRNSGICCTELERKEAAAKDPLVGLARQMGGSKRNALLKWCQQKTLSYNGVDITNFSSSWNDGLAFCALIHSYLPEKMPYDELTSEDKRRNFTLSFAAAESVGITSNLNINDMVAMERPDWQAVIAYVTAIYKHFEVDGKS